MTEEKKEQEVKKEAAPEAKKEPTPQTEKPAEKPAAEKKKAPVAVTEKMKGIIDNLEKMTVMELSDLVKTLEDKFGVSTQMAAMPMMAGMAAGGQGAQGAAEEKTTFTIVLTDFGANKINVIKEIRAITTLGLKEAKDLVEAVPKPVKEGATKEEADKIKAQLEKVGAKVELK